MTSEDDKDWSADLKAIEDRIAGRESPQIIAPVMRDLLDKIADESPDRPRALRLRGILFNRCRDPEKALAHLHQARQKAIERQNLAEGLAAAGFRNDRPAYFQWLGVVPYLTREAIVATLDFIAGIPGSEVVFDYPEPLENFPHRTRANLTATAARAASLGEPWLSLFDPLALSQMLRNKGFGVVEDLGLAELTERFYGALKRDIVIGPGGHVVRAQNTC